MEIIQSVNKRLDSEFSVHMLLVGKRFVVGYRMQAQLPSMVMIVIIWRRAPTEDSAAAPDPHLDHHWVEDVWHIDLLVYLLVYTTTGS
jgi:hypothetical protein